MDNVSRVTQKDIAAEAGVSAATVSNAMGDYKPVAIDTRERIFAIAESIGYVPRTPYYTSFVNKNVIRSVEERDNYEPEMKKLFQEMLSPERRIVSRNKLTAYISKEYGIPLRDARKIVSTIITLLDMSAHSSRAKQPKRTRK